MRLKIFVALAFLTACGASEQEISSHNAANNVASRIWTEPGVVDAINFNMTMVSTYVPGGDVLLSNNPINISRATYGEFTDFRYVGFDTEEATHAQVLSGMRDYCRKLGWNLRVELNETMAPSRSIDKVTGIVSERPGPGIVGGSCR